MSTKRTVYNPLLSDGLQFLSTSAETHAAVTHEPTGFEDPAGVVSTYSTTNRTFTLSHASGNVVFWIFGNRYSYPSPWIVPTVLGGATPIAHTNANGTYFLKININTLAITFDVTPFDFSTDMIMGLAIKGATYQYGQRETHGTMPWQCHESDHFKAGSYMHTAPVATSGTYTIVVQASAALQNAGNTPGVDLWDQHDEDLETNQAAWPQGTYTTLHRLGAGGVITMSTTESYPFLVSAGNRIEYNLLTAGTWSRVEVTENNYVNVLMLGVPTTADVESQKFRLICVMGQAQYTTLAAAQAATPANWDLGSLAQANPEMFPLFMWTFRKDEGGGGSAPAGTIGLCFNAAEPTKFIGSARNLIGIGGISPSDHQALSNRTAVDAHPISSISPTTASRVIVSNAGNTALVEATTTTTEVEVLHGAAGNAYKLVGFDSTGGTRVDGTDAHILAMGTSAERPVAGANGMIRYNSTLNFHEVYQADIAGWGMVGHRWKLGSFVLAGSSVFAPPTAAPTICLGFEMLLRIKRTSDSKEELLQIYSIFENATTWTFSVVSVAGTDLAATITQLSAGQIQVAGFDGTYKLRVSGFIFA